MPAARNLGRRGVRRSSSFPSGQQYPPGQSEQNAADQPSCPCPPGLRAQANVQTRQAEADRAAEKRALDRPAHERSCRDRRSPSPLPAAASEKPRIMAPAALATPRAKGPAIPRRMAPPSDGRAGAPEATRPPDSPRGAAANPPPPALPRAIVLPVKGRCFPGSRCDLAAPVPTESIRNRRGDRSRAQYRSRSHRARSPR